MSLSKVTFKASTTYTGDIHIIEMAYIKFHKNLSKDLIYFYKS